MAQLLLLLIIIAAACISILVVENDYIGEGTMEPPEVVEVGDERRLAFNINLRHI